MPSCLRYKLRTLLILMAVGPPVLAAIWLDLPTVVMIALCLLSLVEVIEFVRVNTPGRRA
jgi:hypothetical protein